MRITLYMMYLLFGIIFGVSCTEIADIDPKERILGVYCVLTNDSIQSVDLRYSSYISESSYPMVDDATVRVSYHLDTVFVDDKGDVVFLDTVGVYDFNKVAPGKWQAEFVPMENVVYTLEVSVPGEDLVTATTRFPKKVDIQSVNYNDSGTGIFLHEGTISTKSSLEPILSRCPIYNYKVSGPLTLWIYGMDYNPRTEKYHVAGYIHTNHLNLDKFNISDKTKYDLDFNQSKINLDSIYNSTKGVFWWDNYSPYGSHVYPLQLWSSDRAYSQSKNPAFSTLWPSNDYSFCHRYLRILHPASGDIVSIIKPFDFNNYPDKDLLYDKYGSNFLEKGESDHFTICVKFNEWKHLGPHPLSHLVFESVSADYDMYLKDLVSFELGTLQEIADSDMTHIWERVEVYSNITNGKGIFGASSKKNVLWGMTTEYRNMYMKLGEEKF